MGAPFWFIRLPPPVIKEVVFLADPERRSSPRCR
jgi:hypothetical protein